MSTARVIIEPTAKQDILITLGPPKGGLDLTHDIESKTLVQVGCAALR